MKTAVVDLSYGDCGKGRIVEHLCRPENNVNAVVRYNGGNNAGNTVVTETGEKLVFHHLPACTNPKIHKVLTRGMVVNPVQLLEEIRSLPNGHSICLDPNIHCILSEHIAEDERQNGRIGTTKKGIGPCYAAKASRRGYARLKDIANLSNGPEELRNAGYLLAKYFIDTPKFLRHMENIVFAGANGIMLDVDYGTYPFVTSSQVGPAAIPQSCGWPNLYLDRIIGVIKPYATRVGSGPLSYEIKNEDEAKKIRDLAGEYGATTGRPRRIGYLDLDEIAQGIFMTGCTELAINHVDTMHKIALSQEGFGYVYNGEFCFYPKYSALETFVEFIKKSFEKYLDVPVSLIGVGPRTSNLVEFDV